MSRGLQAHFGRGFGAAAAACILFLIGLTGQSRADGRDGRWAILIAGVSGDPALQTE